MDLENGHCSNIKLDSIRIGFIFDALFKSYRQIVNKLLLTININHLLVIHEIRKLVRMVS